ncbi:LysR family transcriptional regulator [Allofournierella sp.]|uniref:LysR family transcriptional regulator n=1 Tax=Allofournierella sp. TaxID=1940256 RepID=UPI003AB889A8
MTRRHLHIFLSVCACGYSMTRAAEALYLSQPAVSQAVAELEQYYGTRLFERLGRRLYLTAAGEQLREYAVHIEALFDGMEKGLRGGGSGGPLRVGASITVGSQFLPYYVKAFRQREPAIEVQARVRPSKELERALHENKLDLALVEDAVQGEGLLAEPYMEDELVGVCSRSGPFEQGQLVSRETFLQQKFLLREAGSGTREVFDRALAAAGVAVEPLWESTSTGALVNAAMEGLGVAVLPRRLAAAPLARGRVRSFRVEGMDFKRTFQMVWHKDKFVTPAMRRFMELCRTYELDYPEPCPEN